MSDRLAAWVQSLPPPYAGYDTLAASLARYRAIAASGGWPTVAAAPELKYGASGPAVVTLRKRLAVEDPQVETVGAKFDAALLDAVRRAQRRYGLNPKGEVGAQTLNFSNALRSALRELCGADVEQRIVIGLAKDGSGVGAALSALAASKQRARLGEA